MKKNNLTVLAVFLIVMTGVYLVYAGDATLQRDASGYQNVIQGIFRPAVARIVGLSISKDTRSDSLTSNIVQLYSPQACHYNIGNYTVRADSLDFFLPAATTVTIAVDNYEYIAAKGKGLADTLYITEMQ